MLVRGFRITIPVSSSCAAFVLILCRWRGLLRFAIRNRQQCNPVRRTSAARFSDCLACFSSFVSFLASLSCSCLFFLPSISLLTCLSTAVGSLTASEVNTFIKFAILIFGGSGGINPSNILPRLSFCSSARRNLRAFSISLAVIITGRGGGA